MGYFLVTVVARRLFLVTGEGSQVSWCLLNSVIFTFVHFQVDFLLGRYLFGPLFGFLVLKLGIVLLSVKLLNSVLSLQVILWTVSHLNDVNLISLCLSFLRPPQPNVIHWWLNDRHFYLTAVNV